MRKVTMIGCDLHDESMLLKIAEGRDTPQTRSFKNTPQGRVAMISGLKRRAKAGGAAEAPAASLIEASATPG